MNCRHASLPFTFITLCFAGCAVEGGGAGDDTRADPAVSGAPDPAARYCVRSASSDELSCFGSFTEAIAAATGQQITDAPADARAAVTDPGFRARIDALAAVAPPHGSDVVQPRTDVVVGLFFRDDNFQGPVYIATALAGCDGDLSTIDWVIPAIQDPWNDQISSFTAFSNCFAQLYEAANFGGAQTPLAESLSSVGPAMNDRASSIRFF
jgi:hypothetical protein